MESTNKHQWEAFWSTVDTTNPSAVIWGVGADVGAKEDVPRFIEHIDKSLPMIDFGCGQGFQTYFLANVFKRVIGTDVTESVLERARAAGSAPNVEFRELDGYDANAYKKLHDEVGDANIYMRLTLHQFAANVRPTVAEGLATLMGQKGALFFSEITAANHQELGKFAQQNGGRLPDTIVRVMELGLQPGIVSQADVEALFPAPKFEHVLSGTQDLTTAQLLNGKPWVCPSGAFYGLIRRAK